MNLWILTEELPRKQTIKKIIKEFLMLKKFQEPDLEQLDIVPEIIENKFTFRYIVKNVECSKVSNIFIKIISGSKSFVDYVIFFQENEPTPKDKPLIAIEETKVDIEESRNVTAYQRNTKFVYLDYFFDNIESRIIYFRDFPSEELNNTYSLKFGIRLLMTMGVTIWGIENLDKYKLKRFESYDELIEFKEAMPDPASGEKVTIIKEGNTIKINIKLDKGSGEAKNKISHDPNIGQAASIIHCLRRLNWKGNIVLSGHNIIQKNLSKAKSKLVCILLKESALLEGLTMPSRFDLPKDYWTMDVKSEKIVTIFLQILLQRFKNVEAIFDNHAGCERGYLKLSNGELKDISKSIAVPDLIICDHNNKEILNIEGEIYLNIDDGLEQIKEFETIENNHIKPNYPSYIINRLVVLYGGTSRNIQNENVAFLLNALGESVISENTPEIIKEATRNFSVISRRQKGLSDFV